MPKILVGGHPVKCRWAEYHASLLPKGTPVSWFDPESANFMQKPRARRGTGILLCVWWYDGVIADIDVGGERVSIHLAFGGSLRRLRDMGKLVGQGCQGEGI